MFFGRAWAGNGCRKCFDFSCQMQISEIISLSSKFIEFACKLLCRLCLKCISSAPSCQNRNKFGFGFWGPRREGLGMYGFVPNLARLQILEKVQFFPPDLGPSRCSCGAVGIPFLIPKFVRDSDSCCCHSLDLCGECPRP